MSFFPIELDLLVSMSSGKGGRNGGVSTKSSMFFGSNNNGVWSFELTRSQTAPAPSPLLTLLRHFIVPTNNFYLISNTKTAGRLVAQYFFTMLFYSLPKGTVFPECKGHFVPYHSMYGCERRFAGVQSLSYSQIKYS